jgi:hypothetical protein
MDTIFDVDVEMGHLSGKGVEGTLIGASTIAGTTFGEVADEP